MIPKRMYFFWSGTALSWMRYMTLYSFRKFNPEWEIILCLSNNTTSEKNWFGPEVQDFFNYSGANYLDKISELSVQIEPVDFPDNFKADIISPIHESDLYRYYKLYNNGGFYSDTDILYFRPIDDFYNSLRENNINTVIHHCHAYATIGFLGAEVGNIFYKDLFNLATSLNKISAYQDFGVELIYKFCDLSKNNTSINEISNILKERYKNLNICSIPDYLVYQYDWNNISNAFGKAYGINTFNAKAIGYHWYAGSSIAQKYNKLLTEHTYKDYKTTFTELVKNII